VIAYHADRDTGECWVGQRRLAREAGLARSTVQLALDKLFDDLVLEPVEDARGPMPERYRIAPSLVEGEAFGTGMVEGSASVSGTVEGQVVVGEVIHNPSSSGPAVGPLGSGGNFLVDRSWPPSGPIHGSEAALVDRSAEVTGPTTSPVNSQTAPKVVSKVLLLQGKNMCSTTPAQPLARLASSRRGNPHRSIPGSSTSWSAADCARNPDHQ
jgi:hypothetical protein